MNSLYQINPTCRLLNSFTYFNTENFIPSNNGFYNHNINVHAFRPCIDLSLHAELNHIPHHLHFHFADNLFKRKFVGVDLEKVYFTDGSLINNTAGFGVYNMHLAYFLKLEFPCSVFIAELTALYFACNLIQSCIPNVYFVCTDSLNCLQALNSVKLYFKSHHTILMLKSLLHELYSMGYFIKLVWVPAHCNIYGNEQADSLAKFGAIRGRIYKRIICPSEYFSKLKRDSINSWQTSWDTSDKGRYSYSIYPRVNTIPWFNNLSVERNFIYFFSRLVSNHYICNCY